MEVDGRHSWGRLNGEAMTMNGAPLGSTLAI